METSTAQITEQIIEETTKNTSLVDTIIKFGIGMLLVMAVVWIIVILTPKIAKNIDKFLAKHRPERVYDDKAGMVKSIYDAPSAPNPTHDDTTKLNDNNDLI